MSWFDTPTPPNPIETARAATSTNVATGVANAYLGNVNQVTPDGSLTYNQSGNYGWTDPVTGSTYQIPQFTATQTLSPQGQAIKSQSDAAKYNLAGIANAESAKVSGILASPFNPNVSPYPGGDPNSISNLPQASTSFNAGGQIQTGLGDAGDITQTYGPADNFSADRQRVEDSLMQRMNPQLAIEKRGIEQQLADQGIRYGSQAYASAMDDYNRQANDARFAAIGQAGTEQQRMNQMAAQLAAFQNAAQQQGYEQNLGAGTFANQAQQQGFQQNAAQAAFGNAGLAQQLAQAQSGFNAQQAARNQWMQEQYASRNQPLNEISALMSGSQVSQPNWLNTPSSQIPTTDVAGLINQNFNQQMQVNQQQSQNANQLIGGILGLGAGALKLSDEREKKNIDRVGTVFAFNEDAAREKLPIYAYEYKNDPAGARHVGPMAQDVEKIDPKAVKNIDGRKYLDQRAVMGNILRAA
jgi:hypothetical protein